MKFEQQQRLGNIANPNAGLERGFRSTANATMQVADTLQQFGKFGMENYKQMRVESAQEDAQAVDPSTEAPELRSNLTLTGQAYNKIVMEGHLAAVKNDYTKHLLELQTQYETDPAGYERAASTYKSEMLNNVSPQMRNAISQDFDRDMIPKLETVRRTAMQANERQAVTQISEAMNTVSDQLARAARDGDLEGIEYYQTLMDGFVTSLESMGQFEAASKARQTNEDRLDEQMVLGRFDAARDKDAFIRNFMKNPPKDLAPELADRLSGTMITLRNRLKSEQEATLAAERKTFSVAYKDHIAYLSDGNEETPEMAAQFSEAEIRRLYPDNADSILEEINDTRAFGRDYAMVKSLPQSEVNAILEGNVPEGSENYVRESQQLERLALAAQKRAEALADDPATFVAGNDDSSKALLDNLPAAIANGDAEAVQAYTARMRASQEYLGVPAQSVAILPNNLVATIATQLNDTSQGGEHMANTFNLMKELFGDEWNTVMRQLAGEGEIGTTLRALNIVDDPNVQAELGDAMIGFKEYKEVIDKDALKDITDLSTERLTDLTDTMRIGYGESARKTVGTAKDALEALATKLVYQGKETSGDNALDTAFEMLFGDTEFIGSYRVPKSENPSQVEIGVDVVMEEIKTGVIDIYAPPSTEVANPEDAKDLFRSRLALTPITSVDGTGIVFVDQQGTPVLNPDGSVLEMPWDQLRNRRDYETWNPVQ